MVRGAPLVKENHSTSQNRWARTSPRSTFVLQTVRWCTPPFDRLTCWDEVTFFKLEDVLLVVGFCWFRLEILPVFVAPPWSEVWQSLSFAENCLAWKRGFHLRWSFHPTSWDCRGRQPWIWILICRRSPWWAAKALESHWASTTKMRILLG